jgi:hypothetical protein
MFVATVGDFDQIEACHKTGAETRLATWTPGRGDYALKINKALESTDEPWMFLGADDLEFEKGWASEAFRVADETGALVIGTNDGGGNPRVRQGSHSTHSLVARCYAEECGTIDEPGKILHEGYDHQYCDDEMVATAKARKCFAFAQNSRVTHLHPYFGTAAMDETYRKGQRAGVADRALFAQRRELWERQAVAR